MKRVFHLLIFLFPFVVSAQVFQPALLYGKKENRFLPLFMQGLPTDTATIATTPENLQGYGWIAEKNGIVYYWSTVEFKWKAIAGGGSSIWGGVTGNISNQLDLIKKLDSLQKKLPLGTDSQYYAGDQTLKSFSQEVWKRLKGTQGIIFDSTTGLFKLDTSIVGGTGHMLQGKHGLNDHVDVSLNNPLANQVLKYDAVSQKWYNGTDKYIVSFVVNGSGKYRQLFGIYSDGTVSPPTTFTVGSDGTDSVGGGAAQVPSDWIETDPAQPSYIRNKPNNYADVFNGTTANSFTVAKTPIASSISVYVNGQRIPKSFFTLSVNTVSINAALLGYSTDTFDKVEISYQSIQ